VVLLHETALAYGSANNSPTAAILLGYHGSPLYTPDVMPSDYHLFLHMKRFLTGKQFHSDAEVETTVNNWLQKQVIDFFDRHSETCDMIQQVPVFCW
jgi:hypothetical protein